MIEPHTLPWQDAYKLLIGSVLPRPIALVSTVDAEGTANLAPFSFFTAICAEPMLVCFAPMLRGGDGHRKDTLNNILQTNEFVINIVSEPLAAPMNACSREYPPDVDEFLQSGLSKAPSFIVKPPRVEQSLIHLECVLEQALHFGDTPGAGSLVIGRVVMLHIRDELYQNGKVDIALLQPLGRMAGQIFTRAVADTFVLERPATPGKGVDGR